MNMRLQNPLFTDLPPEQAEMIAAAGNSFANASYGTAAAGNLTRTGSRSFKISDLIVQDTAKDGKAVYAKIQGQTSDGTILTTSTKRYGTGGLGKRYRNLTGSFSEDIVQFRVAVYREQPGRDPVTGGNGVPG